MGPAWCRYFDGLTSDQYVRHEPSRVQARLTEQRNRSTEEKSSRVQQKWGRTRDDRIRPKTNVHMGGRAQQHKAEAPGQSPSKNPESLH